MRSVRSTCGMPRRPLAATCCESSLSVSHDTRMRPTRRVALAGGGPVFFMGGPQLGELEAGLVAQWFGAPFSVVNGGLSCLAATGWLTARTPELRRYERPHV